MKILEKTIVKIENTPTSFLFWITSFLGLIAVRILIENWLGVFQNRSGLFLFYEFTHTLLFFLIVYLLFLGIIEKFLKIGFKKISNVLLWGYLIILTPPIIDNILSGGTGFWSFYDFGSIKDLIGNFFTFFDNTPEIGITYGVRIEVALAVIFLLIYGYIKSKNILKSLALAVVSYAAFFILATFPSWITIMAKGFFKGFLAVGIVDTAQMFLAPAKIFSREITDIVSSLNIKMSLVYSLVITGTILIGLFFNHRKKLILFLKNSRPPQLIYHGGLLIVGIGLGLIFNNEILEVNFFNIASFLVLLIATACAWLSSVVVNDLQDKKIDAQTNAGRPLIKGIFSVGEYKTLGWVLFSISILFSSIVNFKVALLFIAYQAVAWLYSSWPLRLKRIAFISTFTSAVASLMVLFSGYILISPLQNIENFPFSIIALLVIGYTLSLPVKDFRDAEGDRENEVYTIPVVFGNEWGKIIVGSGIFISFILSVVLLNEFRLFWWALIFGGASFWTVIKHKNPRTLPWWILGIVFIYGVVLIRIVF